MEVSNVFRKSVLEHGYRALSKHSGDEKATARKIENVVFIKKEYVH